MKSQRDVRIVAWFFFVSGLLTVAGAYRSGRLVLSTGLFGIPIGIGLLGYRTGWRTVALVWLWFGLVCFPLHGGMALLARSNINLLGSRSPLVFASVIGIAFLLEFWQYRVLTLPEVGRWFDLGEASAA